MVLQIFLNYLQMLWITGVFKAKGPELFREIMGFASLSNGVSLDMGFVQCVLGWDYDSRFAVYMSLPLLVPSLVAGVIVAHRGLRQGLGKCGCCKRPTGKARQELQISLSRQSGKLFNTRLFVSASVILLVQLHSRITREVFAVFQCHSEALPDAHGSPVHYLASDLGVRCDNAARQAVAGVIGVVFGLGLPLGLGVLGWRLRRQELGKRMEKMLGFFYLGYSGRLRWWSSMSMIRKVREDVCFILCPSPPTVFPAGDAPHASYISQR